MSENSSSEFSLEKLKRFVDEVRFDCNQRLRRAVKGNTRLREIRSTILATGPYEGCAWHQLRSVDRLG
jgi:hypothetical protein